MMCEEVDFIDPPLVSSSPAKPAVPGGGASAARASFFVLLLTAWYALGLPFALWRGGSLEVLTQVWSKTLLIFLLLTQTLVTAKRIQVLLWAIILSELVVTGFSIMQSSQVVWVGERLSGVNQGILGWNFLGFEVALTIPYIAALFITERSVLSTCVLAASSLSMLWMLVLTASRG